jgi:hypothetical protein
MKTQLIHCSYHKCLTKYYGRTMNWQYNRILRISRGYRHFDSRIDDFYRDAHNYRIASINNRAIDLCRIGDCRVSRFVRDPRDMVVSGYFYHKRGAENWCQFIGRTEDIARGVNGCIPEEIGKNQSFSAYLQSIDQEDGLIAEIEFRKHHFESMLQWPTDDPRIKLFRYEDIIGNEEDVFAELLSFYGLSWPERKLGAMLAKWFSTQGRARLTEHIRNPKAGQWKEHFTPKVNSYFEQRYGEVLRRYGYD